MNRLLFHPDCNNLRQNRLQLNTSSTLVIHLTDSFEVYRLDQAFLLISYTYIPSACLVRRNLWQRPKSKGGNKTSPIALLKWRINAHVLSTNNKKKLFIHSWEAIFVYYILADCITLLEITLSSTTHALRFERKKNVFVECWK